MDKSTQLQLRELGMLCARAIDNGATLSITELETALNQKNIILLLQRDYDNYLKSISMGMESADTSLLNDALYNIWIGEYNPAQPGRSGQKWGTTKNGLCLLINLSIEALTQN